MKRERRWVLAPRNSPAGDAKFSDTFCALPCIAILLQRKGLLSDEQATEFLHPRLRSLSDPFLLPDMPAAVDRILRAITAGERIVLYGDYDVDGVTSLALLNEMLCAYGARPTPFLPSRMEEGYGLSREGIERCWQTHRPQLLIAVDCGTSSSAEIANLRARGVDVIVLDHHEPKGDLPDCVAVVNPKAVGNSAFCYLCSVGIVFKLCHALLKTRPLPDFDLRQRLDLVALGTVADIVPLEAENRVLVHHGARQLALRRLLGVSKLMDVAAVRPPIVAEHIGFRLGPRLNAAGRLTTAEKALQLLLTADLAEATALAGELDGQNRERQSVEHAIVEAAERKIAEQNLSAAPAIALGERGWHPGVLGIVASRLARNYHRPTIVVGFDQTGLGKGSGRSIPGLSLVAALGECAGLLEKFGGHEMAAGLTIREENFATFTGLFQERCRARLSDEQLEPRLHLDGELMLSDLNWELLRWHELLQPFGNGNPQPLFLVRAVEPAAPPKILKEKHLLLRLRQNGHQQRAIFFGGAESPLPEPPWDVAFRLSMDEYEGERRLQMQVEALRAAAPLES
ncbi:MAG TPA: single-stranded-DNA-specific exonuclease RecJ [Chthoniobacterales bacterium]|nr:single-stranded-DNA-specific exonuclease RecJ [Chthoniobacterales bacterium]